MTENIVKSFVWNFCADPCDVPLGLQDGRVTPSMLTASSMYNHYYGPWSARLQARNYGSTRGGWIAKYRNANQWLQIDLGAKSRVKRISTQGRYDANQFVKSYTVSYSQKGDKFVPYREGRKTRVCWLTSHWYKMLIVLLNIIFEACQHAALLLVRDDHFAFTMIWEKMYGIMSYNYLWCVCIFIIVQESTNIFP